MTTVHRALLALLCASPLGAQTPFFASPDARGVVLRWVWPEQGARPAGYFVERRASSASPWTRLTPRPVTRVRDRSTARAILGAEFDRYSGLLFATSGGERGDAETVRGMQLVSADLEPGVARVLGLRFDDSDAVSGSAYEYRLVEIGESGERVAGTSGAVIAGSFHAPAGPTGVVSRSATRGAALRWTPEPRFSGYHVYRGRRRDGSDARRVNEAPVIVFVTDDGAAREASTTFFTDTAPPADSVYYRIRGIDMFGRLSAFSDPSPFTWRPPVVVEAPVLPQARVVGDTVVVSWQVPAGSNATRFQLWRSESATGGFERIGAPVRAPQREQRDPGRPARRVTWYRVTALDDAARESEPSALAVAEVPDHEPPAAPDAVTAIADTGRITLSWRAVAAPDVRGYRLYRASTEQGTYVLLSPTPRRDTRFVDTVALRADHPFYYRVVAVDSAFNESAPSAIVSVRLPDVTPPSAPRISTARAIPSAIVVDWLPNPEPDVVSYRVRFRARADSVWRTLIAVPATQRSDTIPTVVASTRYEVTVLATDDAGNSSAPARSVVAKAQAPRSVARPEVRSVTYERRERAVVISWSATGARDVLVSRREPGTRAFRLVGSARASAGRFVDRSALPGVAYEYTVRSRDIFGNEAESNARALDGGAR